MIKKNFMILSLFNLLMMYHEKMALEKPVKKSMACKEKKNKFYANTIQNSVRTGKFHLSFH